MALNKAVFKTRAITAIIFAAVMLCGLLINGYLFISLFSIVMIGCIVEVIRIIKKIWPQKWGLYFFPALLYASLPLLLFMSLAFQSMWDGEGDISNSFSPVLPVFIIVSIWVNDTMAYIVGSLIGKTPFSKISPKKTWEGTGGGVILCIVVMFLLGSFVPFFKNIPVKDSIIIAAICGITGTIGDLFESKLKRMAGIKDSGSFMPGHGGFLDRFDSLLFAAPAVWAYIYFTGASL